MASIRNVSLALLSLSFFFGCDAWVIPSSSSRSLIAQQSWQAATPSCLFSTTKASSDEKEKASEKVSEKDATTSSKSDNDDSTKLAATEEEDDDDDEYEYIEYEDLAESDFLGSEWLVGTCWDSNNNDIKETWVRLAVEGDKNLAVWGDNTEGSWSLDAASQFLAISKEFYWGKQIWAGVVDDYYFVQGTVRGWTYLTPASVLGQWQAKRLGVDPEEAGTAPWFLVEDEDDEKDEKEENADDEKSDKAEP